MRTMNDFKINFAPFFRKIQKSFETCKPSADSEMRCQTAV